MDTKALETVSAEKLNSLLDWVGETTKSAQGFVLEQAPLVAQEIVAWELWASVVWVVFGAVGVACLATTARVCWVKAKNHEPQDNYDDTVGGFVVAVVFSMLGTLGLFFGVCAVQTVDAVKAKVAPRLVIVDYVAKAVK